MGTNGEPVTMQVLHMPSWKSKILNGVAWILGYRGENAYVITMNINIDDLEEAKRVLYGPES